MPEAAFRGDDPRAAATPSPPSAPPGQRLDYDSLLTHGVIASEPRRQQSGIDEATKALELLAASQ